MKEDNFKIQVKTFFGLEQILANEIQQLGGRSIEIKNRLVECIGDLGFLYKLNFSLHTGLRVLMPIYSFNTNTEEHFYNELLKLKWDKYLNINQSFAIDFTVNSSQFNHSQYMALKMKDAIVDYFKLKNNERPSVNTKEPDILFNLYIHENHVIISLDSSGEPLYKRNYRISAGEAPINEVLAAGILKLADWNGKGNLLDPMCGSGTFLIEATFIACNIPPQINRTHFGFMNWKNYNNSLWKDITNARLKKIKDFNGKIMGYDKSISAMHFSEENINNINFQEFISLENKNFFTSSKNLFPLLIIMNPPYNERLVIDNNNFYNLIGTTLKHNYPNTISWIISSDIELIKNIGLKPSKKIKLFNGKLECNLIQIETYEGSKKINKYKK